MILKSMSRKGSGETHFAQLYDYIHRDHVPGYEVWHNFMRREPGREQVVGDFVRNGRELRSSSRHNILYHEIISLTRGDRAQEQSQVEALHDLAQRYLEERAPGQLAYGVVHVDKDHSVHMHLLISANDVGSEKRVRLPKHEFLNIQRDMETYLQQRYPEMEEPTIYNKPWERSRERTGEREKQMERRGAPTKKTQLKKVLRDVFEHAPSLEQAGRDLADQGIGLEQRGSHVVATKGKLRCRLRTLGIEEDYEAMIERCMDKEEPAQEETKEKQREVPEKEPAPQHGEPDPASKSPDMKEQPKREPHVQSGSALDELLQEVEQEVGEKVVERDPFQKMEDAIVERARQLEQERRNRDRSRGIER